jgi:hypothetical protein
MKFSSVVSWEERTVLFSDTVRYLQLAPLNMRIVLSGRLTVMSTFAGDTSGVPLRLCSGRGRWAVESMKQWEFGPLIVQVCLIYIRTPWLVGFSHPYVEWQIIDIALQTYDKVSVSLYDTLGKDSVGQHITYTPCFVIDDIASQNICNMPLL